MDARKLINKLNWSDGWHTTFVYETDARPFLPKGTVLITTSLFDNTKHKGNPDPDQWVVAGSRTVDEMSHIWIGMTFFDNEADFQELVTERNRVKPTTTVAARRQDAVMNVRRGWPDWSPAILAAGSLPAAAQHPTEGMEFMFDNLRPSGQPVIPIFDGWYPKPMGPTTCASATSASTPNRSWRYRSAPPTSSSRRVQRRAADARSCRCQGHRICTAATSARSS